MRPLLCLALLVAVSAACSPSTEVTAAPAPEPIAPATTTEHVLVGVLAEADKTIAEQDDMITRQLACIEDIGQMMTNFTAFSEARTEFGADMIEVVETPFDEDLPEPLFSTRAYLQMQDLPGDTRAAWDRVEESCPPAAGLELLGEAYEELRDDALDARDQCQLLDEYVSTKGLDVGVDC